MLRLPQGRLPPAYWVSRLYFCSLFISNTNTRKPVLTLGADEKWKISPGPNGSVASTSTLRVNNHFSLQWRPWQPPDGSRLSISLRTRSTNTHQHEARHTGLH